MAFEGAQMVPVYDMNKSDGDGFMGGGAGWMWVVMLFFLLAWGGGFGGFGGNGTLIAVHHRLHRVNGEISMAKDLRRKI